MTKKPSERNKTWEKDRRDRLNRAFEELAKLLPQYDPTVNWTKNEIIQKSIEHIENLHKKRSNILNEKDPESLKEYNDLLNTLEYFKLRNGQLAELLRKANITIPEVKLPKFLEYIPKFGEENDLNITTRPVGRHKKYSNQLTKDDAHKLLKSNEIKEKISTTQPEQKENKITIGQNPSTPIPPVARILSTGVLLPILPVQPIPPPPSSSSSIPTSTTITFTKCKILNVETLPRLMKLPKGKDGKIKLAPRPTFKLYARSKDGKIPIVPIQKRKVITIKRKRRRKKIIKDDKCVNRKRKNASKISEKCAKVPKIKENTNVGTDLTDQYFSTLQIPQNESNPECLSPTAAFLLSFPVVSTASVKNSEGHDETALLSSNIDRKAVITDGLENLNTFFTTKEYYKYCEQENNRAVASNIKAETTVPTTYTLPLTSTTNTCLISSQSSLCVPQTTASWMYHPSSNNHTSTSTTNSYIIPPTYNISSNLPVSSTGNCDSINSGSGNITTLSTPKMMGSNVTTPLYFNSSACNISSKLPISTTDVNYVNTTSKVVNNTTVPPTKISVSNVVTYTTPSYLNLPTYNTPTKAINSITESYPYNNHKVANITTFSPPKMTVSTIPTSASFLSSYTQPPAMLSSEWNSNSLIQSNTTVSSSVTLSNYSSKHITDTSMSSKVTKSQNLSTYTVVANPPFTTALPCRTTLSSAASVESKISSKVLSAVTSSLITPSTQHNKSFSNQRHNNKNISTATGLSTIPSLFTTQSFVESSTKTISSSQQTSGYYFPYQAPAVTSTFSFNLTPTACTATSTSTTLSQTQSFFSYGGIQSEIPWLPVAKTDYKPSFTFSLTPSSSTCTNSCQIGNSNTIKSFTTLPTVKPSESVVKTTFEPFDGPKVFTSLPPDLASAAINFTFSLAKPKNTVTVSTDSNMKPPANSTHTQQKYQTTYQPYNFDNYNQIYSKDTTNFTFALTKPTQTFASSFSIDATLGVPSTFPPNNCSNRTKQNPNLSQILKTPPKEAGNHYSYDNNKTIKSNQKGHVNWMTSSDFNIPHMDQGQHSTYYPSQHVPNVDYNHPISDDNFPAWSPSKILDTTALMQSTPLPTFYGDINTLGTSSYDNQKHYPKPFEPEKTKNTNNPSNQANFFSVSQLVEQEVPTTTPYDTYHKKAITQKPKDTRRHTVDYKSSCSGYTNHNMYPEQSHYQEPSKPALNSYSAEALLSKKEKHRNFPALMNTEYFNPHPVTNNSYMTSQDTGEYNSNYFYNYVPNQNFHQENDYLGAYSTDMHYNKVSGSGSIPKPSLPGVTKNDKKLSSVPIPPTHPPPPPPPPPPAPPHPSNLISYDTNYFPVPPLVPPPPPTIDTYDPPVHHYTHNSNIQHTGSSWNPKNTLPTYHHHHHGHVQGMLPTGSDITQTNVDTNLQQSTNQSGSGNLTNFNLSTICPEINDKVAQSSW